MRKIIILLLMLMLTSCTTLPKITWVFPVEKKIDERKLEKKINLYLKDKIEAKVKVNPIYIGYYEKNTFIMLLGNKQFDLMYLDMSVSNQIDVSEHFMSIERQQLPEVYDLLESYYIKPISPYLLPTVNENYTVTWLAHKGDASKILHNIEETLIGVKNRKKYPLLFAPNTTPYSLLPIIPHPTFSTILNTQEGFVSLFDNNDFLEMLQTSKRLKEQDLVAYAEDKHDFEQKVSEAYYFISNTPISQREKGYEYSPLTAPILDVNRPVNVVSKNTKNPKKVMELIKLLYTDKALAQLITEEIKAEDTAFIGNGLLNLTNAQTDAVRKMNQEALGQNLVFSNRVSENPKSAMLYYFEQEYFKRMVQGEIELLEIFLERKELIEEVILSIRKEYD